LIGEVPRVEATLGFKTDPRWGTESSGLVRPKAVRVALMAMGGDFGFGEADLGLDQIVFLAVQLAL
jgi:hypothetical protein